VIGGIVIMNIMLVSVTERTREIGVRKALGARRKDILLQFLIESATMSLLGGIIGVTLGITMAKIITLAIAFPSVVEIWSIVVSLFVATSVGLFFGVYPAYKASELDPITACERSSSLCDSVTQRNPCSWRWIRCARTSCAPG